jgi:hypothetical protein
MSQHAALGWNLALCAGACAASWLLVSPRFTASLALGALLESVNFRFLWASCERVLGRAPGGGAAVGAFGVRFVLLAVVLWAALRAGAHPVGLVVGLSLMVPAILVAAWRVRPLPSAGLAPPPPPDDPTWDDWNPWLAREREGSEDDA